MPTVAELGQAKKAQRPGVYDDIDDASLGLAVQAKHPGSYDDFSPAPPAVPTPPGLQGPAPGILHQALENLPSSALGMVRSSFPPAQAWDQFQSALHPETAPGLTDILSGIAHPYIHPLDAFASDPLGTLAAWSPVGEGIRRVGPAVASGARGAAGVVTDPAVLNQAAKMAGAATAGDVIGGHGGAVVGGLLGAGTHSVPELLSRISSAWNRSRGIALPPPETLWKSSTTGYMPPIGAGAQPRPEIQPVEPAITGSRFPEGWSPQIHPDFLPGVGPAFTPEGSVLTPEGSGSGEFTAAHPSPAISPVEGGSPMPANSSTFKHPAQFTDLIRQYHATHPRGSSLRADAQAAFGLAPGAMPSYEQSLAIHEWRLAHPGQSPTKGLK